VLDDRQGTNAAMDAAAVALTSGIGAGRVALDRLNAATREDLLHEADMAEREADHIPGLEIVLADDPPLLAEPCEAHCEACRVRVVDVRPHPLFLADHRRERRAPRVRGPVDATAIEESVEASVVVRLLGMADPLARSRQC